VICTSILTLTSSQINLNRYRINFLWLALSMYVFQNKVPLEMKLEVVLS